MQSYNTSKQFLLGSPATFFVFWSIEGEWEIETGGSTDLSCFFISIETSQSVSLSNTVSTKNKENLCPFFVEARKCTFGMTLFPPWPMVATTRSTRQLDTTLKTPLCLNTSQKDVRRIQWRRKWTWLCALVPFVSGFSQFQKQQAKGEFEWVVGLFCWLFWTMINPMHHVVAHAPAAFFLLDHDRLGGLVEKLWAPGKRIALSPNYHVFAGPWMFPGEYKTRVENVAYLRKNLMKRAVGRGHVDWFELKLFI